MYTRKKVFPMAEIVVFKRASSWSNFFLTELFCAIRLNINRILLTNAIKGFISKYYTIYTSKLFFTLA